MKIKKIDVNGYDVYIYKTKKYSSIYMRFLFEMPYNKRNIYCSDILEEYMIHSSRNYKTRKEIEDKRMELYSLNFGMNNSVRGEKMLTHANFSFYDPDLVKDDYIKDALTFTRDILLNPNFDNGVLDKQELRRSTDNIKNSIGEGLMDYRTRASNSFIETLFPNSYMTEDIIHSIDEFEDLINSFKDKDYINMHDKLINNSLVGLVIMGNFKDEYIEYLEELFKFKSTIKLDRDFKETLSISKETDFYTKISDVDTKESALRLVYNCPARSYRDKVIYNMISRMLSGTGNILFKVLRDEMKLVYSTNSSFNNKLDYMVLSAYIDKKNVEAAEDGIKNALKRLENRELVDDLLTQMKEKNEMFIYTFDENKTNLFYELYDKAFKLERTDKERVKIMEKVTTDDILNALKKMELVKVFFYEGVKE